MAGDRCTCGQKFLDAEDWRDHMPCEGTRDEQLALRVSRAIVEAWESAPARAESLRQFGLGDEGVNATLKSFRDLTGGEEAYREAKAFLEAHR